MKGAFPAGGIRTFLRFLPSGFIIFSCILREIEVSYFFARERIAHIAALDLCDRILAVEQFSFDHYETDGLVGFVENFALNYEHLPGVHVFQVVSLNAVSDRV